MNVSFDNCVFSQNQYGVFNAIDVRVVDSVFSENVFGFHGGVTTPCSCSVERCLIADNTDVAEVNRD